MEQANLDIAKQKIVAAVEARWSERQSAYLLSQLGKDFPDEVRKVAQGRKLLDVLRSEFKEKLSITSKGEGGETIWAIVPSFVGMQAAASQIPAATKSDSIRFNPALWAAFRVPLEPLKTRFVIQQGTKVQFEDFAEGISPAEETILQLGPDDVSPPVETSLEVSQRIKRLLLDRGIPLDRFTSGRSAPQEGLVTSAQPKQNLLDELLNCLSPGEARRVSIPLDIIDKLRNRIVGQH